MLNLLLAATLVVPPHPPAGCTRVTTPFVGTVCAPHDAKRRPLVIMLGGSDGGNRWEPLLPRFVKHGYVAASIAYFGLPGLPQTLVNIPVETVGRALGALTRRADVDAKHIAIVGISRGGEFAYLAAATYPQITAAIGIVPSPIMYMGLGVNDVPTGCAWSWHGTPLPCVAPDPQAGMQIGMEVMNRQPVTLTPFYEASRKDDPAATRAAFIHLERIHGPVLCLAGKDDAMWDSSAHCDLAMAYLRAHHHRYKDRAYVYPGAGHFFIVATHGPKSALEAVSEGGVTMMFGGTPDGNAAAATAAWKRIWSFLGSAL